MNDITNKLLLLIIICVFTPCSNSNRKETSLVQEQTNSNQFKALQKQLDSIFTSITSSQSSNALYCQINNILGSYIDSCFHSRIDTSNMAKIEIEYSIDTFKIAETMRFFQAKDNSISRLDDCITYRLEAERLLIEKYYQKLNSILKLEDKEFLIRNKQQWNASYISDKELSNLITSPKYADGRSYHSIIDYASQINRIQFLYNCYYHAFLE